MIYSIILYSIFVLPISLQKYKKDSNKWLFIKILNSAITLFVFVFLSGNLKRFILGFSDNSFLLMKNVSLGLNLTISFIYGAVSFFAVVQSIRLALRIESAIVPFLILIPFLWIFTGIDKYYAYVDIYNQTPSIIFIVIINIVYAIIWGFFFIFYKNKKTRVFFSDTLITPPVII